MSIQELLNRIRPTWLKRVANTLARGSGVRENFQPQLEGFFDRLAQAFETGDPSWLDEILTRWATSPTESELELDRMHVSAMVDRMLLITQEVARETLDNGDALDLILAITPIFTQGMEKAAEHEMASRVTYVSNELSNTQQILERLDQTKSNFIAVAAHELKTPLTLIEGYTSMMRDLVTQQSANGIDALLQGVNNGVRRLREIVDDMVDVSLIDNDSLSLNFQPIWLSHILDLLRSELAGSAEARKQTLALKPFPGGDQMIFADPERLYQAFRNILINGIKYTPDGGRITVDGRLLPGFIEVTFTDTGIGISPEDQELIFQKFGHLGDISLHSSGKIKFKGGGPGLGLPIARGIVEAHGGTIWVESRGYDEINCPGSTFHVLLPARNQASDPRISKLFGPQSAQATNETHGEENTRTDNPTA